MDFPSAPAVTNFFLRLPGFVPRLSAADIALDPHKLRQHELYSTSRDHRAQSRLAARARPPVFSGGGLLFHGARPMDRMAVGICFDLGLRFSRSRVLLDRATLYLAYIHTGDPVVSADRLLVFSASISPRQIRSRVLPAGAARDFVDPGHSDLRL